MNKKDIVNEINNSLLELDNVSNNIISVMEFYNSNKNKNKNIYVSFENMSNDITQLKDELESSSDRGNLQEYYNDIISNLQEVNELLDEIIGLGYYDIMDIKNKVDDISSM